jgi:hypothetical protein
MQTHTSLHADHQLDQWAAQFAPWRQHRSHPGARMPQHLWDQAAALAQGLPRRRVAQHLRLSPSDLHKHMATRPEVTPAAPCTPPPFIEVPSALACVPELKQLSRATLSDLMGHASTSGAPSPRHP